MESNLLFSSITPRQVLHFPLDQLHKVHIRQYSNDATTRGFIVSFWWHTYTHIRYLGYNSEDQTSNSIKKDIENSLGNFIAAVEQTESLIKKYANENWQTQLQRINGESDTTFLTRRVYGCWSFMKSFVCSEEFTPTASHLLMTQIHPLIAASLLLKLRDFASSVKILIKEDNLTEITNESPEPHTLSTTEGNIFGFAWNRTVSNVDGRSVVNQSWSFSDPWWLTAGVSVFLIEILTRGKDHPGIFGTLLSAGLVKLFGRK